MELTVPKMEFLGEFAKWLFNDIVYYYITVRFDKLEKEKL